MVDENNKEYPSVIDLYNKQYGTVVKLVEQGKQKELNKAVDTLLKLFSLGITMDQKEQEYEILALEQEEIDEMFDEMDEELLEEISIEEQKVSNQLNTEAIMDKSIEYYTNVRSKLKEQLEQDVLHIRNMSNEELKEYINSLLDQ